MASKNFDKLWVDKYMRDQEKFLNDVQRTATMSVWSRLTLLNPFDTGRSRAGWIATIMRPSEKVPPEAKEGQSIPRTMPKGMKRTKTKNPNFIVNNVEYIVPLDEGHSPQRPAGWIDRGIDDGISAFKSKIKSLIKRHKL